MGSFFLTSKKASATLVFLVVSILVVSSGVIIVNEVEKSNNKNKVVGTGLVLLDNEQDNSQYSDSSDDEIKFTFGDSGRKTSSKKSSGGGGGASSSALEIDEGAIDIPAINETASNQDEINYTGEINETETDDFMGLSSEILSRNGTAYIMRDGEEYVLSTSSSTYYIEFNPALPSSVCENEGIDIIVKGKAKFIPTYEQQLDCSLGEDVYAYYDLCIYEYDPWPLADDIVQCTGFRATRAFSSSGNCLSPYYFYFEEDFLNVDISDAIIPDPGGNGEFYAIIKQNPYIKDEGIVYSLSTSSYDVYGYVNDECDCLSGACCDLSSRPYEFKPDSSQPTDYDDFYYCSTTNSPTGTNYCVERDFYCSGNSASSSYSNSNVDTCGICEYCTAGDSTCNYYSSLTSCGAKDCDYLDTTCRDYNDRGRYCDGAGSCSTGGSCNSYTNADEETSCGTKDCDSLDTTCRDYDDMTKYCDGEGSCGTGGSCNSYTNEDKGTSCGTNKECNSSGSCITCTSHSYKGCSYDDVYWYDACDNKEEKKQECGDDSCSDWYRDTCYEDDAYETQTCVTKGCLSGECYSNQSENERFVETCEYGCENGNCKPNPIECTQDEDCPNDHYVGNAFCFEGNVSKLYRDYLCAQNPETSYCTYIEQNKIIEHCSDYCEDWGNNYCKLDDVYYNKTCYDNGCSDGACFNNNTYIEEEKVQECGDEGCLNNACVYVECYEDDECGVNNYVGDLSCQEDNVWQNYITYICNNATTSTSYCSNSTALELKENCGSDYCEDWGNNYCKLDDVYHEKTCHDKGCSGGACFDDTYTEEEKVQECGISEYIGSNYCYSNDVYRDYITRDCSDSDCISSTSKKKIVDCTNGCIDGRCKTEVCKIVCNFGMCYEYCIWQ